MGERRGCFATSPRSPEMWQVMRMSAFGKARSCGYPIGASLCASVFFFAVPNANAAVSADFGNPSTFQQGPIRFPLLSRPQ